MIAHHFIKTHKADNSVRVIFLEKFLFTQVLKIKSRVQDTSETLNFFEFLNDSNILNENFMLVSFDIVNTFPSIEETYILRKYWSSSCKKRSRSQRKTIST